MKAIGIRQPWVDAVLYGGKRIENRGPRWGRCRYRGPLLLHASANKNKQEYLEAAGALLEMTTWQGEPDPLSDEIVRGAIVGMTELIDIVTPGGQRVDFPTLNVRDDPFYMGGFGLVFGPARPFDVPIPYKGALGLFNVPDDVVKNELLKFDVELVKKLELASMMR